MSSIQKPKDGDKFVMESTKGGQWFYCKIVGEERKEKPFRYEIISVHYSEDDAVDKLKSTFMFNTDKKKSVKVIKAKQKELRKKFSMKDL